MLDALGAAKQQPERARFNLIVILDGQVVGRALQAAADAYGEFLGLPAVLP